MLDSRSESLSGFVQQGLSDDKKVRLVNAISKIGCGNVEIRATRRAIEKSAKHDFTKLVLKCDQRERKSTVAWNSCKTKI